MAAALRFPHSFLRHLRPALLLAFLMSTVTTEAVALPFGPDADLGAVITAPASMEGVQFGNLTGPAVEVGFEMGDWFNSKFYGQLTSANAQARILGDLTASLGMQTYAAGYQLTFELFGKAGVAGFTPFIGGGILLGDAHLNVSGPSLVVPAVVEVPGSNGSADAVFLELHGVVGLRYHIASVFGAQVQCSYSTYGGFTALEPMAGAYLSF